jgi:hypothetical protein
VKKILIHWWQPTPSFIYHVFESLRVFRLRVRAMVFTATFKNISAISWGSVLLVEETGVL